jgi:tetratricopeptide (TPR) repeat protein
MHNHQKGPKMLRHLIQFILLIIITACSGIKPITERATYSEKFLVQIQKAQTLYKGQKNKDAIANLNLLKDEQLTNDEKALKYNWIGIIYFADNSFEKAMVNFNKAISFPTRDQTLSAQINLNISSTFFKLNQIEDAFVYIKNTDDVFLNEIEKDKYNKLYFLISFQLNKSAEVVKSILKSMQQMKLLSEVAKHAKVSLMIESFAKLSKSEKTAILEEFSKQKLIAVAYMALHEVRQLYYLSKKSEAIDIADWIKDHFDQSDVLQELNDFNQRIENVAKINSGAIGVILPLSGEKAEYGQKALEGVDYILSQSTNKNLSLFIKDNQDSAVISKVSVKELVEKHSVAMIIGGLFAETAAEEYLEARRYGVLFISLSPIYLPKEEKNHLLIEIPGSVESQLNTVFSKDFLATMGTNVAFMYPQNERGSAYLNEFWRKAQTQSIKIKAVASYPSDIADYREHVSKALGLHYKRERNEEFDIWSDIWANERTSIRRIQTLPPVVDFDWVFIPSHPKETIQLLPVFSYFDAKGLKFVGGPSWRSKSILKNYKNLGKVYFIGDDQLSAEGDFAKKFNERFGKNPMLVETMASEATKIATDILNQNYSTREEFELKFTQAQKLKAVFGEWNLVDNIWIKNMSAMKYFKNNIQKIELNEQNAME